MSEVDKSLSSRVRQMLELTDEWMNKRCSEIQESVEKECAEIVCNAHRDARLKLRHHYHADRHEARQRIISAEAALKTKQRQQLQELELKLLETTWSQLEAELLERWREPNERKAWLESTWSLALKVLPKLDWTVTFGEGMEESELENLIEQTPDFKDSRPRMVYDRQIIAGLRIQASGASVDGTLSGLLANRKQLESEILSTFLKNCPDSTESENE